MINSTLYKLDVLGEITVLTLKLDAATIFQDKELIKPFYVLLDVGRKNIVLDLSHTSYISSLILSSLVIMLKKARKEGGNLVLCGARDPVKDLLNTTKLDRMFEMYEDRLQAVKSLKEEKRF